MKNTKITIFGCSVALRIRPAEYIPNNNNYGIILENLLNKKYPQNCNIVQNFAFSRATIFEIKEQLENYITTYPDFFILNIGVPDASTREIPYWFAQILNKKKDSNIKTLFLFIHAKIFKKRNAFFVKLRRKQPWVSAKKFKANYIHILKSLNKETNAKIICLSINPANKRVESKIPGSSAKYKEYNKIIEKIAKKYNAYYISFDDLVSEKHYPDGIHFNTKGHKIVAERLFKIITKP